MNSNNVTQERTDYSSCSKAIVLFRREDKTLRDFGLY